MLLRVEFFGSQWGGNNKTPSEGAEKMTDQQKKELIDLRAKGYGYKKISQLLGVAESTVSAYCQRNKLTLNGCKNCGKVMQKSRGTKTKKFCCDKCRMEWWNRHLKEVSRKANYTLVCRKCGKSFISYGNTKRKYCSHTCYISDRLGKGESK